jgi:hypothetical protein
MVSMNRLSTEKRAQIIGCLVEGNSIRATVRMTGAAKNTVTKLLADLGAVCAEYQDKTLRDLPCTVIEADEIWSYCYSKQRNVPDEHKGEYGYGDVWTWTALCADTKLVPSWLVGERTVDDCWTFMEDLKSRLAGRIQLSTDGHQSYVAPVGLTFRGDIDWAQIQKTYRTDPRQRAGPLQPSRLHGDQDPHPQGRPRPRPDLHQLRRAPEPHDADGDAPVHAAD